MDSRPLSPCAGGHAGSTDAAASGDDGDLPAAEKYGTISKQPVGNIRNMWKTKVRRRLPLMMLLWVAVGCCGFCSSCCCCCCCYR